MQPAVLSTHPHPRVWLALAAAVVAIGAVAWPADPPSPERPAPAAGGVRKAPELRARPATTSRPALEIVAVAEQRRIRPGESLPISFSAVNRTDRSLSVLRALDASDMGWRYPKITVEVRDARGELVTPEPGSRCGNINRLVAEDFVELAPGAAVDLFGEGAFGHHAIRNGPSAPGVYTVVLRYDLSFATADRTMHDDLASLVAQLPKGVYRSPAITIEVAD